MEVPGGRRGVRVLGTAGRTFKPTYSHICLLRCTWSLRCGMGNEPLPPSHQLLSEAVVPPSYLSPQWVLWGFLGFISTWAVNKDREVPTWGNRNRETGASIRFDLGSKGAPRKSSVACPTAFTRPEPRQSAGVLSPLCFQVWGPCPHQGVDPPAGRVECLTHSNQLRGSDAWVQVTQDTQWVTLLCLSLLQ